MKKLIVITTDSYIRNYFDTDAFSEILDGQTFICASENLKQLDRLKSLPNFAGTFSYDEETGKRFIFFFNVQMLRYKDLSQTFEFRYMRLWFALKSRLKQLRLQIRSGPAHKVFRCLLTPVGADCAIALARHTKTVRNIVGTAIGLSVTRLLSQPTLAKWTQRWFERKTPPNPQLERILQEVRPDLVLIPSQGIEPTGTDLLRLQQKFSYQTFFLIDNWDNLSSKSVFPYPPDYLGVWGQQSVEHAWSVHQIPQNRVFKLGTPRFDEYFRVLERAASGQPPAAIHNFPYILFTGCSLPYDETTALTALDQVLQEVNGGKAEPLKLLYRPHPWRLKRLEEKTFEESKFQHVVMDPSVREAYYKRPGSTFQPSLDDYPGLLYHARLVVGPLTSMLLESSLFSKRVLALAYDDGIHLTAPHNALKYYKHFEGIEQIPGFDLVHELDSLPERFKALINLAENMPLSPQGDSILAHYLYQDSRPYAKRLKDALASVDALAGDKNTTQAGVEQAAV